jgi:putative flippase GtrA
MKPVEHAAVHSNLSLRSLLSFLAVGGFATAVHYALTSGLVLLAGLPLVPASAIGFAISALANYLLNARLTFRSTQAHRSTAPRFVATAGTGLLINSMLLSFLTTLGLHAIPAQILTTLGVLIWNYTINGLWTFKRRMD